MADKTGSSVPHEIKEKVWKCKDCKLEFSDIYPYTEHLESKDHIKGIMKNKYGEKYLVAKAKLDSQLANEKLKSNEEKQKLYHSSNSSSNDEDDDVYTCEICKKVCTGYISYKLHLEGKKHKKMLHKVKLLSEMKKQDILPEPDNQPKEESLMDRIMTKTNFASSDIICKVCKKQCTGPEAFKQHCKSKSHAKKVLAQDLAKGLNITHEDESENAFAHCDICQKGFSGPIPFMQHMESGVHLKQAKQIEELGKLKDLAVGSEEDSRLQCKECGKMFSGTIPFNAHLKSSIHGKLKKKSALLKDIESEHPEMFKSSALKSNDSDDDDHVILGCEICHIVFSGPEAARDHFSSLKHKKAKKKKAQFQMYKNKKMQGNLLETAIEAKDKDKTSVPKNNVESENSSEEFDIISNP